MKLKVKRRLKRAMQMSRSKKVNLQTQENRLQWKTLFRMVKHSKKKRVSAGAVDLISRCALIRKRNKFCLVFVFVHRNALLWNCGGIACA